MLIVIGLFITLTYSFYKACFERTPASIVKKVFNVEIKSNFKLETFREQWDYNGDGYCIIVYNNVERADAMLKTNVEVLPLKIELPPTEITSMLSKIQEGEYWVKFEPNDSNNLYLFFYDRVNRKAVFYYQFL